MTQKLWNKCKKCGCEKPEDTEKLCEQCKANRRRSRWRPPGGICGWETEEEIAKRSLKSTIPSHQ